MQTFKEKKTKTFFISFVKTQKKETFSNISTKQILNLKDFS